MELGRTFWDGRERPVGVEGSPIVPGAAASGVSICLEPRALAGRAEVRPSLLSTC
jgi:hypothetical protein